MIFYYVMHPSIGGDKSIRRRDFSSALETGVLREKVKRRLVYIARFWWKCHLNAVKDFQLAVLWRDVLCITGERAWHKKSIKVD